MKKIISIVAFLLISGTLAIIWSSNQAAIIDSFELDGYKISIEKEKGEFYLSSAGRGLMFNKKQVELQGFEDKALFCDINKVIIEGGLKMICLTSFVGAHSQNLQLVAIENGSPRTVNFYDGNSALENISSDLPKIRILDYNEKRNQIEIYNRNYDKNPIEDALKIIYRFNNGRYEISE